MNAGLHFEQRPPALRKSGLPVLQLAVALMLAAPLASQDAYGQRSGQFVFDTVCATCHKTGEQGAPKVGDRAAWAARASQGLSSLTQHALDGIRNMPAHGGNPGLSDLEIGRGITYMVNQSGGSWVEPASAKDMNVARSGEQVVAAQCVKCHEAGTDGAPRIGDRNAWSARMKQGVDNLVRSAIRGHGGMPPRGGQANLTDGELRSAVLHMFNPDAAARPATGRAPGAAAAAPAGGAQQTAGAFRIHLGFVAAESLRAYPPDSIERTMHGGVPQGSGYYHLNVSVFDRENNAPIADAKVEARIERRGMGGESKTLEPMPRGAASYGSYVKVIRKAPYQVTVRVRAAGSPVPVEARFEHSFQ